MKILLKIIFLLLLITNCRDKNSTEPEVEFYKYEIPKRINDGWNVASVDDVSLNKNKLADMISDLSDYDDHQTHSILIVKDSKLVFEKYFRGYLFNTDYIQAEGDLIEYDIDTLHYMASVSKSVTSVLFGIAIDQGANINISEPLANYYPEYQSIFVGEKAKITIQNILTMSAGLNWDETTYSYGNPKNDVTQLFINSDPIKFILEKPIQSIPGLNFSYNSGYTNLLADIIQKKTTQSFLEFAEVNLFEPLKISDYKWSKINSDLVFASGGLYLSSRSLAKIGQLYLNKGEWEGKQLVSEEWINLSTQSYINPNYYSFSNGYGFQWWRNTFTTINDSYECYFAAGWGEQYLFVFPKEKMVIVITSGYFFDQVKLSPLTLVNDHILYALLNNE